MMRSLSKFASTLALVCALSATSLIAAGPDAAKAALNDEQRATLSDISRYFSDIRTMQGEFVQFGPNGERAEGKFFLARPGRIRFHYAPPARVDIIADGTSVSIKDRKLATQDIWPLNKTPLRFLLAERINLTSDANVTSVSVEPDLVTVTITEDTTFVQGKLTLIFDAESRELKQWTVTDAQGLDTSVAIYNVEIGKPTNPKLFVIDYLANTRQNRN